MVIRNINCEVGSKVYVGVPQGSIVGPLLWDLVYDGLLNSFNNTTNLRTVAFADDLAILIGVNKKESVKNKLNDYVNKIIKWCNRAGLQIATDKTVIILTTGMRIPKIFKVNIIKKLLTTSKNMKYLGIMIHNRRNYTEHLASTCCRVDTLVGTMESLLPNVNGPTNTVRRIYYNVWESVVLYASPVWAEALNKIKKYKNFNKNTEISNNIHNNSIQDCLACSVVHINRQYAYTY